MVKIEGRKELLKTKTFWTGILSIALGIYLYVNGKTVEASQLIIIGLGLIGLRDAIRKIEKR